MYKYVQYSRRLSGGEHGVRWCQMVCLSDALFVKCFICQMLCSSDACSVASDGVVWLYTQVVKMVSDALFVRCFVCQMLCLSDACSVASDGVVWLYYTQLLSGGEDGVRGEGEGIFNLQLCIYSVASFFQKHVYQHYNSIVHDTQYSILCCLVLSKTCIPTLQFNCA